MRNNNMNNNFFFGFEIKSVMNVSCGKPDVACHSLSRPPMCVKLIHIYETYEILIRDWVTILLLLHHSLLVAYDFSVGRMISYTYVVFVCLGVFVIRAYRNCYRYIADKIMYHKLYCLAVT